MDCASCGHENPEGFKFCGECGSALKQERTCPSCNAANPLSLKFCGQCGTPLTVSGVAPTAPPAPQAPPLPTSFGAGRYAVRAFLGEGAKKRVYLAHDTRLDREVAFAQIKTEGLDADGVARIRREAQAMGRLGDHAHIVTVFDAGEEDGTPFIVSQHMSGGSVEDLLAKSENHRIPADRAMRIAVQVADALSHAHARGIVHRDLKPGNVWLDAEGNAALGDFGLAVAIDRSRMTMQGMMVGTVAYMAPEQALGRQPDARSDLYSLGAMLYEMVAGRPPFLGDDAVGVISQHINTAPVAPSWHEASVPTPLESLILRLLAKSPDERPNNAQAVVEELRRILARSTVTAHPQGAAEEITDLRQLDWGRFVGRRDEMAQLKAALEHALSGRTALAFIAGEPGIGKTRLAEEFAVYAGLRGAQVLTGRSYEGESSVPYRPFVEALRQYARSQPDGDLRQQMGPGAPEIATMISEVRQRFPDIQEAPRLEGDAERLRLFDSITAFLRNASVVQPIVLLLDDLHWVDRPSLLLLQHVARHATNDRLLLMATYRDVELERTHPLSEALAGFRRMERFTRIPLRGLVQDEVFELLNSIESDEETAQGRQTLAQAIWRETEGNPFFIKEVLQHLVETGKLRHEHGHWTAGGLTIDDLAIPEGVREVIGRRLSRLSEGANTALTRASAMTRGFTWEQFRAINTGVPETDLLDVLDEALRSQMVGERKGEAPVSYDFTHALIRQTLYEELSTPRRLLMHREIAHALEDLYAANTDAHVGELAHHFFQAAAGGDPEKAIDYCTRAGDRAADLNGHDDAIAHYERALQVLELSGGPTPALRCELLTRLGRVQHRSGQPEVAVGTLRKATDAARTADDAELLAQAVIDFADAACWVNGDVTLRPKSTALLTEAIHALGDRNPRLRVLLLGLRTRSATPSRAPSITVQSSGGYQAYMGGRDDAQVDEAREALRIAEELEDDGLIAFALGHLRGCLWRPDNPHERLRISARMVEHSMRARDVFRESEAHAWLAIDHLDLGLTPAYEHQITEVARVAAITRQPLHAWWPAAYGAVIALARKHTTEAEQVAQQALEIGQAGNAQEAPISWATQISTIRTYQGRWVEVAPMFHALAEASPDATAIRLNAAAAFADGGDVDAARRELEALSSPLSDMQRDYIYITGLAVAAQAAWELRDKALAEQCAPLLRPFADFNVALSGILSLGSAGSYLGLAATVSGDYEEAEDAYELALEKNTEWRHLTELARAEYWFACMLMERDAPGDRHRASELCELSLARATELGMDGYVKRGLDLKMHLNGLDPSSISLFSSIDRVAESAQKEAPAVWRDAVAPDGTVTIMFSDIEDSTVLTERLGDARWQDLLRAHDAMVRSCVTAHGGFVVKHLGDGFMLAFQSAKNALECAIAIQRAFGAEGALPEPVRVRIGMHAGEAVRENDDFFGKNVVMASRVASQAKGGEILVSSVLRSLVESSVDPAMFGEAREVELKGLEGTYAVHGVRWQS